MYKQKLVWLVAGILIGLFCGGFLGGLTHSPLHAVATDRQDNFAIATVPLNEDQEAVVFLDFLTGDLKATVFNVVRTPVPTVGVIYTKNILQDLGVDATKNPKFLMVSGRLQLRPQGQMIYSGSVIYVAEVNSGKVGVYAMPYNNTGLQQAHEVAGQFQTVYVGPFRQAVVR
jgi:hypothetical protein